MREDAARPLLLPGNVVFTCQNSGACCRHDWLIGVDALSHAKVREVDWGRLDPALAGGEKFVPLRPPLPTGEAITFARKAGGECVFLTADARCGIHTSLGYRDKPQVCKEFPYSFVETPDGIAVGLSFACTAVRGHHGKPLGEQAAEIRDVLRQSYRVRRLPDRIELFPGVELGWPEYARIEAGLLALFEHDELPLPAALIAGSILVSLCLGLKRAEERAERAGRASAETLLGGLAELERDAYRKVLAIATGVRPPARPSATYLAPLYAWLQLSRRRLSRVRLLYILYATARTLRAGRGRLPDAITGGPPFDLAAVERVAWTTAAPDVDRFLREYWSHVVFRKTLTPMHGVFRGYQTILALYGFARLAARLHAHQRGRAEVALEDVQDAVRLVEQRFVLHAQFAGLFGLSRTLTAMADRLYRQPAFVRAAVLDTPAR